MSTGRPARAAVHRRRGWPVHRVRERASLSGSKGGHMTLWHRLARDDRGMATVEYALVTVAAAAFAGVLLALLKSAAVKDLLMNIVERALG